MPNKITIAKDVFSLFFTGKAKKAGAAYAGAVLVNIAAVYLGFDPTACIDAVTSADFGPIIKWALGTGAGTYLSTWWSPQNDD